MRQDLEKSYSSNHSASTQPPRRRLQHVTDLLRGEVDSKMCTCVMVYACFLTGFTSAITFTACYIWCGFQTGNVAQLGVAVARTFQPGAIRGFHMSDKHALCSLLSFLLGTSVGRIGDKIGNHTRKWLISATIIQALMLMAAALTAHYGGTSGIALDRGDPSWTNPTSFAALGFASASLGLQGIIGKRLNTQFATAVVLTTVWVELVNDPFLFALRRVDTRDHKAMSILAVFLGAFISKALVDKIGSAGTLGIAAGLRFIGAWAWLAVPSKVRPPKAA
ncbi:hypothetical protein NliqN6_1841 [Naganishia liquefaciens]|uniref:DUF1275 domain-containing protein n=1 Tax=Naganishia liquefaciens TaxID=104408 RepID=A0A8H3TR44_9TREE|nr:hypothetical protein NliqN6_1841 [Naganishia liquefaciens]